MQMMQMSPARSYARTTKGNKLPTNVRHVMCLCALIMLRRGYYLRLFAAMQCVMQEVADEAE